MIQLTSNGPQIQLMLQNEPPAIRRAMVRAMNRAMASARTVMKTAIAEDTGLKSGDVLKALPLSPASLANPRARLAAGLKRIALIDFKAKAAGRRGGVRYKIGGESKTIREAFIRTMKSGHQGVFVRRGAKRLPIQELYGPSLGHVFAKYRPDAIARLQEAFTDNFGHELQFARSEA